MFGYQHLPTSIFTLLFVALEAFANGNITTTNETTSAISTTKSTPSSKAPADKSDENKDERLLRMILNQIQNKSDSRLRPKSGREPILVLTDMFFLDIGYISEANMEFRVSFFLRMYWKDERLAYNNTAYEKRLALNSRMVQHMWIPDIYFVNEKFGIKHDLTKENEVVRLWPNGTVFHSMSLFFGFTLDDLRKERRQREVYRLDFPTRLSMTASCPMTLHNYPLDKQVCKLAFESFSYEATELLIQWKKGKGNEEVSVAADLQIPQFILTNYWTEQTFSNFTSGDYSRLIVWFQFERSVGFFLIQTYIPAYLIVMLSWIAFWINHNSTPARVALGITTVLTMTTLTNSARASLPKVSYVKSIEWFLILCFLYVFASLVEYACVSLEINRKLKKGLMIPAHSNELEEGKDLDKKEIAQVMDGNVEVNGNTQTRKRARFSFYGRKQPGKPVQYRPYSDKEIEAMESSVDNWSRVGFPLSFVIFNIIYWVLTIQFS